MPALLRGGASGARTSGRTVRGFRALHRESEAAVVARLVSRELGTC
jgi:hypothetical protein